ncbi:MAG: hypothetical protein ACRENL_07170 [Candidatus Dormibacteria bacterium]
MTVSPLVEPRVYGAVGVRLDPPAPDATASQTADQAMAECAARLAVCAAGSPQTAELGLLTDKQFADSHRLVWALTWKHVACDVFGPGRATPGAALNLSSGCAFVTFIDARSGRYILATEGADT